MTEPLPGTATPAPVEQASSPLPANPLLVPTDAYFHPELPTIWFGIVLVSLALYVALDGFDFGTGMIYATRTDEDEREALLAAFGPVWDANEVWLVAFATMLLAAFPAAYAGLLSEHYLLGIAIVMTLVFRGVAPELREQRDDETWRRRCDRSFVFGSTVAPLLIGTLVGSWAFATGTLALPAVLTGLALVALSLSTGGAWLAAKTEGELRAAVTRYGLLGTGAYLLTVLALVGTVVGLGAGGGGSADALASPAGLAILGASVALGVGGGVLARLERFRLWFASTSGLAVLLVVLVAHLLHPAIYPAGDLGIEAAAVSPAALNLLTLLGVPVLLVVLGYFAYLYSVFGGQVDAEGYGGESSDGKTPSDDAAATYEE